MIWIRGTGEVSAVALIAIGEYQLVIPVRVARLARRGRVCARQRELGGAVVKCCRLPSCCCMARLTILAEVACDMIWIRGTREIGAVALVAAGEGNLIIVVGMTHLALNRCVRSSQWKLRRAMIKRGRLPRRCRVAHCAVLWKTTCLVIGICRRSKIRPMAIDAICRQRSKLIVRVTLVAGDCPVGTGQRELRIIVCKGRGLPYGGRMTRLAVCRKSAGNMVGIRRGGKLGLVAHVTIRWGRFERGARVTRRARHSLVCAGQRKTRESIVIETCVPRSTIHCVTLCAVRREPGGCMIRVRRAQVIVPVTTDTRSGDTGELVLVGAAMAILTRDLCVDADERKASRLVFLYHVGDVPRLRRVASEAIGAELRFMNVGMTGSATTARSRKLQVLVTTGTRKRFVLTFENKPCLRMIEFRIRPHLPRIGRMTRLARNFDVAVRRILCNAHCRENKAEY